MKTNKSKKSHQIDENGMLLADPPKDIGNKEKFQRLNYLYQLSTWTTMTGIQPNQNGLARLYSKDLDLISKKTKTSISPNMKRSICKKCHRILIPTITSKTIIKNLSTSKSKKVNPKNDVLECHCQCGVIKRYPIGQNRNYKLNSEKDNTSTALDST
ncbi:ribonuclease P protein subunit RPR2 NDAI_0H01510 [Naumovozyma dairenensis CBS 421]|uniref:Uncharacterized protein n=1 Tax=Naumovozyma dairenensis (strain ATCC 10597 / BCRC 20456 / CBS 421 / NBRC 0211 / NRRL Y-12639) TaxID=1071378 RepID=G0WEW4_NAUDC|nr:hypothetical protein NDAI_0H01510 [Naumovozyma dairenensis CBS 421]CCD26325.1 hypothetical protein NDAI_0H01510 [Naumovozyma dairenensis CBS 421]